MKSKGIRILDKLEIRSSKEFDASAISILIELNKILEEIEEGPSLNWSILFLDGITKKESETPLNKLVKEIGKVRP